MFSWVLLIYQWKSCPGIIVLEFLIFLMFVVFLPFYETITFFFIYLYFYFVVIVSLEECIIIWMDSEFVDLVRVGELFFNKWTLYKFENFFDIRTLIYLVLFEGILHQLSNNELVFLKAVNKIKNVATINVIIEFISLLIIFITLIKIQNIIIVVEIFIVKNLILLLINKIYKNKQLNK